MEGIAWLFLIILASAVALVAVIFLVIPLFKGIAFVLTNTGRGVVWVVKHIFSFIFGMVSDVIRAVGGVITTLVLVPMILVNIIIGRWSASGHYGRVLQDEVKGVGHSLYRVVIGHPARFLLLHGLTEGIEKRIPEAYAHAPGADRPSGKTGQFDGYKILGSLPGGGSGGRLYVAEPDDRKLAAFARAGEKKVSQVVIKCFSLDDGSSLPQIIRESRALEAAKKLGLILDHELTDARFFYVMEFIPGDSLTVVTKRLHTEAGPDGLREKQLAPAMAMIADLLTELARYHHGGLWHKDVKPDNIIINQGRAHLVDLGLITPLRSAMTLTTHGTEYFRDPELVRMALKGAKVNEVDGVKFDIYGVGAVLYSVIENSFPAHGGLSQITRSCPEALRWVVRRAMTELDKRYATAADMYGDLRAVMAAPDPFMLKPIDLPSMSGGKPVEIPAIPEQEPFVIAAAATPQIRVPLGDGQEFFVGWEINAGAPKPAAAPKRAPADGERRRPSIGVTDWWTGRYAGRARGRGEGAMDGFDPDTIGKDASRVAHGAFAAARVGFEHARRTFDEQVRGKHGGSHVEPPMPAGPGRTASEQISAAQERVRRAQERISKRMHGGAYRTSFDRGFNTNPNKGIAFAVFALVAGLVFVVVVTVNEIKQKKAEDTRATTDSRSLLNIITDDGSVAVRIPVKREPRPAGVNIDVGPYDGDLAELNEVGEKIAGFFDRVRDKTGFTSTEKDASATHTHPVAAAEPGIDPEAADADPAAEPAPAVPTVSRGSVLIISFLAGDPAEDQEPRLNALASRLESRGFFVRLEGRDVDPELFATARRVAELGQPDDPEAVARVRAWLNEPGGPVDTMLWIGQGRKGEIVNRLISRDSFNEKPIRAALQNRADPPGPERRD